MNPIDLTTKHTQKAEDLSLLDRVVLILEQARANVVRVVDKVVGIFGNDTMTIVDV